MAERRLMPAGDTVGPRPRRPRRARSAYGGGGPRGDGGGLKRTVTMRAVDADAAAFRTSLCHHDASVRQRETLQTQVDNLRRVIASHAIPATAIHHFSVERLHAIIRLFNETDWDHDGFVSHDEIAKQVHRVRWAAGLGTAAGPRPPAQKLPAHQVEQCKALMQSMDFNGDGTLDLREFLQFITALKDKERDEFLELSEKFATTTTAHGLGRVVNETSLFRRALYGVVFLLALSAFSVFTGGFVKSYTSWSRTTAVTMTHPTHLDLPRITLCPTAYVMRCDCPLFEREPRLAQFQCTLNRTRTDPQALPWAVAPCGHAHVGGPAAAEAEIVAALDAETGSPDEALLLRYASHPFAADAVVVDDDVSVAGGGGGYLFDRVSAILECMHGAQDCSTAASWDTFLHWRHGVCATYRGGTGRLRSGSLAGMTLTLRAHAAGSLLNDRLLGGAGGFQLFVESPLEPRALRAGVALGVGVRTEVGVKQTVFDDRALYYGEAWRGAYTDCTDAVDAGHQACVATCEATRVEEACGCTPLGGGGDGDGGGPHTCSMVDDLGFRSADTCVNANGLPLPAARGAAACCGVVESAMADEASDAAACIAACRLPCRRHSFDFSSRSVRWPSIGTIGPRARAVHNRWVAEHANAPTVNGPPPAFADAVTAVMQTVSSECLAVRITPDSMEVLEVVSAPAMDIQTLFGAIGGTLGLFIGFSIITVFELCDFVIQFLQLVSRKTRNLTLYLVDEIEDRLDGDSDDDDDHDDTDDDDSDGSERRGGGEGGDTRAKKKKNTRESTSDLTAAATVGCGHAAGSKEGHGAQRAGLRAAVSSPKSAVAADRKQRTAKVAPAAPPGAAPATVEARRTVPVPPPGPPPALALTVSDETDKPAVTGETRPAVEVTAAAAAVQ